MQEFRYCPSCGYSPLTHRPDINEQCYECPNCEKLHSIKQKTKKSTYDKL